MLVKNFTAVLAVYGSNWIAIYKLLNQSDTSQPVNNIKLDQMYSDVLFKYGVTELFWRTMNPGLKNVHGMVGHLQSIKHLFLSVVFSRS